ncbi:MAG TPA: ABC transporter substrate-binding protein [Candidatus Lustribacter sp.]|nr:ABC transporter substrate-binding protein [Candidatus Lustribacter sp.]
MKRRAFVVTALALGAGGAARAQTPSLVPIRLISAPSDDLRPVLYAQKAGLFRRAGLDVTLQITSSGAVATQAVLAGAMDIGKSNVAPLISAYARGLPFVIVAPSIEYKPDWPLTGAIMVTPASPLRSALDLPGKTVACTALGDIAYLGIRAIIDNHGGDSSTVKWVELPTATVPAALDQGRIDAGLVTEPAMSESVKAGKLRQLADMLGEGGYARPILESAYYTTHAFADQNREALKRFAAVIVQANAYSNTHDAETVPLWAALAGLDLAAAVQIHRTFSATSFDPRAIQPVIDLAAKYHTIPRGFGARDFIAGVGAGESR